MDVMKQMFLNLALLFVILFTFRSFYESRPNKPISAIAFFIYYSISISVSLLLSVKSGTQVRFDLRQVPLIVGGLYLGPAKSLLLLGGTIFIRSFLGLTQGFWASSIIYLTQTLIGIKIYKWFHQLPPRKRVGATMFLSLYSSLAFVLFMKFLAHPLTLVQWSSYIIASCLGVGILTATVEAWRKNQFLNQKIMKTEKIEAISQMSAAISHEVRNPLTTVRGFLQLLMDSKIEEKKRKEYLDIALLETLRAERIINDYLTFAKPSIDNLEKIDVSKEIKQAINIIKALANMNTIEIITKLQSNIFVMGDPNQFKQCLVNILKNGAEAMPKGGILTVNCYQNKSEILIVISDTGLGMTSEQIGRLGEPYYSTKGSNGTGLGMMVTFGIIRAMNGKIHVESEVGKGSSFCVTLPSKVK